MSKYGIKYELKFNNAEKELDNPPSFPLVSQEIDIGIYDRSYSVDDATPLIINTLIGGPDPFHLKSVDNDEDKFTPVRSIQAAIQYDSTNSTGLETFTNSPTIGEDPGDPRWYVEIKIGDLFIFKGFLVLEDCSEAFMPKPNIVTLIASDGLGWLRNIALVTRLDANPTGYNRIADFLCMALAKTGLQLNLNAVFNIRTAAATTTSTTFTAQWIHIDLNFGATVHYFLDLGAQGIYDVNVQPTPPPFPSSYNLTDLTFVAAGPGSFALYLNATYNPGWINGIQYTGDSASVTGDFPGFGGTDHLFNNVYLNAKTFEDKIGTCVNCLQVIEMILGEEGYLTQRCGQWWILRVDEIEELLDYTIGVFLPDGSFNGFIERSDAFGQYIGKDNYTIFFSQEATDVLQTSQHKFVKETNKFELPLETPCNVDFSRGQFLNNLPDEVDDDGTTLTVKSYSINCWDYVKAGSVIDSTAYIVKRSFDGIEKDRFVRALATATDIPYTLISRDQIPVGAGDKFDFSVSVRFQNANTSGSDFQLNQASFFLYGDDGTFWMLRVTVGSNQVNPGNTWYQFADATFPSPRKALIWQDFYGPDGVDMQKWNELNFRSASIPRTGYLIIGLLNEDTPSAQYKQWSSLKFDYIPYINGSYDRYDSIYDKVTRSINFRASREKQVYISDGIRPLFKGAMFTATVTPNFTDSAEFTAPATITIPGDRSSLFVVDYIFTVTNTTSNNRVFHVEDVFFNGTDTVITVAENVVTESAAIATFSDMRFILANKFFNWKAAPTPATDQVHPYLHIQTFDVWNQYRNVMNVFHANCQGLNTHLRDLFGEVYYPSLIHTYFLQDPHTLTNNRRFILLTFDQDWYRCEWKGTLAEAFNTTRPKSYEGTDNEEVKYE